MNLFERRSFEAFARRLAGTEMVRQWGDASVAKIGGKIYAILSCAAGPGQPGLSFKCSDLGFMMLAELRGVRPAPYLARAKWVQVVPGSALGAAELANYIEEARRLVVATLTRAMRAELEL